VEAIPVAQLPADGPPMRPEHSMKYLFESGKLLLLDLASTFFFLVLYLLTHNVALSVVLGMALGIVQIGWQFARKKPIDTMQWMSLFWCWVRAQPR
jgi:hypothetical protein